MAAYSFFHTFSGKNSDEPLRQTLISLLHNMKPPEVVNTRPRTSVADHATYDGPLPVLLNKKPPGVVNPRPVMAVADEVADADPIPVVTNENAFDQETGTTRGDQIPECIQGKGRSILESLVFEKYLEKFLSGDVEKMARELAIMDWNAYKHITIEDIKLNGCSTTEEIHKFTLNYRMMYYWTLETILSGKDTKTRNLVIQKLIRIANALINRNNFNLSHSIVQAISSYPIQRLEKSWKKISNSELKMLNYLKGIFDKDVNYLRLTEKMEDAHSVNNICIPYFDLFLEEFQVVFNNPQQDHALDSLRRIAVVVEDLKKLLKFQNESVLVEPEPYRWIDSLQISLERIDIIQKEAVTRSHSLEPVKRYYKILKIVDRRSLFKMQSREEKSTINFKRRT